MIVVNLLLLVDEHLLISGIRQLSSRDHLIGWHPATLVLHHHHEIVNVWRLATRQVQTVLEMLRVQGAPEARRGMRESLWHPSHLDHVRWHWLLILREVRPRQVEVWVRRTLIISSVCEHL